MLLTAALQPGRSSLRKKPIHCTLDRERSLPQRRKENPLERGSALRLCAKKSSREKILFVQSWSEMKKILLLGAFLLLVPSLCAQEPVDLSPAVDQLFPRKDAPGCAVGVIKDGRIIHKRGYGMANLDFDIPISPATVFNVASLSKQFTAMSIALLAQQGKISLDDDIRKYVSEIPDYGTPITIRQLVYHTSGIRDYIDLIELSSDRIENVHTDKDILDILARQKKLNFKPGENSSTATRVMCCWQLSWSELVADPCATSRQNSSSGRSG
jgi:hypothetical protein